MTNGFLLLIAIAVLAACANGPLNDAGEQDAAMLERHAQQRAANLLAPGERLTLEIIQLDRAGRTEPWRQGLGNARVVRDVYPARIELAFRVTGADGALLKEGRRSLNDLPVASAAIYGNDPLRYERALLDEWLERELRRSGDR